MSKKRILVAPANLSVKCPRKVQEKSKKSLMKIIIDNGHGFDTPSHRSPRGGLYGVRECEWSRECARRIFMSLACMGYDTELLVPEANDISLTTRVRRANRYGKDSILISIHNAFSSCDGEWHSQSGFTAYVAQEACEGSRRLATCIANAMECLGIKVRKECGLEYAERNLTLMRNTVMPSVQTENLFMDNKEEVKFLSNENGINAIAAAHVAAIVTYIKNYEKVDKTTV